MNILDSFYFLFRTDASGAASDVKKLDDQISALAAKGQKRSEEESKELNNLHRMRADTIKDLKDETKAADDLGLSFSKLALAGVAALEGFATLGKLKDGVLNAINYNAQIEKTAKLTNINARELSLWNDVVAKAGGNPSGTEYLSFITKLNQQYAGVGLNQRIKFVNRDLGELADKIKALNDTSPGSGYAFAQKLGIGDDFYLALKDGKAALDANIASMQALDNTTEKSAKSALELKGNWAELGTEFRSIATDLIPIAQLVTSIIGTMLKGLHILAATISGVSSFLTGGAFGSWDDLDNMLKKSFGIGGGAPASSGSSPADSYPSGIHNNNPGNLRFAGQAGATNNKGFASFPTLAAGTAAEQRQLQIYGNRGINTLAQIGSTWAPSNENNTRAYIAGLAQTTGYDPNQPLNMSDPAVRAKIANAINAQEQGRAYGNLIGTAQSSLGDANNSPLNSLPSTSSSSKSITIGHITINSAATDAKGLALDLHQELSSTVGSFDDGVDR